MGKIVAFMGKSSAGKDTLKKYILRFLNFKDIPQCTTRPMRDGETEGVEYKFKTETEFAELLNAGKVLEYRTYNTQYGKWYYFTLKEDVDINNDDIHITICTLESYHSFVDQLGRKNIIPIYLYASGKDRLERSIKRSSGDTKQMKEICRRFLQDEEDFSKDNLEELDIPILDFCGGNAIMKVNQIEEYILKELEK